MKTVALLSANTISLIHAMVIFVVGFGWWFPALFYVHGPLLFLTLLSWMVTGSCVLAVWEFRIRKAHNPKIIDYEHSYLIYHLRSLTPYVPRLAFVRIVGLLYLSVGLILWIINFFQV